MSDTVLTAASPQGRIIALPPGDSGQVLRSQGSGKAPVWQTPSGGGGRTYMRRLNSAVSVTTSTSSSGSATLFNETIVPEQDTIIVQVNVSAWVTSSSVPATPGQPFLVRVFKDAALIANIGASPQSNSAVSGATQGRLTVSYSLPLPVTPGSPVNIRITLQSLFTNSGSMTLGIDPSTPSNSASLIIYDLPQF